MRDQPDKVTIRRAWRSAFAEIRCEATRHINSRVPRDDGTRWPHRIGLFCLTNRAPKNVTSPLKVFLSASFSEGECDGGGSGNRASPHSHKVLVRFAARVEQVAGIRFLRQCDGSLDRIGVAQCFLLEGP